MSSLVTKMPQKTKSCMVAATMLNLFLKHWLAVIRILSVANIWTSSAHPAQLWLPAHGFVYSAIRRRLLRMRCSLTDIRFGYGGAWRLTSFSSLAKIWSDLEWTGAQLTAPSSALVDDLVTEQTNETGCRARTWRLNYLQLLLFLVQN